MTVEQAIAELKSDIALYETEICKPGDGSPDGDLMEALEMAIAALEQESKWISVDDALPKNDDRVLVCGVRNGITVCRYWENSGYGGHLQYMFFTNKQNPITVTHWMPLPKPPEVKG